MCTHVYGVALEHRGRGSSPPLGSVHPALTVLISSGRYVHGASLVAGLRAVRLRTDAVAGLMTRARLRERGCGHRQQHDKRESLHVSSPHSVSGMLISVLAFISGSMILPIRQTVNRQYHEIGKKGRQRKTGDTRNARCGADRAGFTGISGRVAATAG